MARTQGWILIATLFILVILGLMASFVSAQLQARVHYQNQSLLQLKAHLAAESAYQLVGCQKKTMVFDAHIPTLNGFHVDVDCVTHMGRTRTHIVAYRGFKGQDDFISHVEWR